MTNENSIYTQSAKTARTLRNIRATLSKDISDNSYKYKNIEEKNIDKITTDILKMHGLDESNFDFVGNIENTVNSHILNNISIDANANKAEKTVEYVVHEVCQPVEKAIGYDMLYRQMKKDWGKDDAKKLSKLMYNYALAISDSTRILKPYCYSLDAREIVLKGRNFGQLPSKPAKYLSSYIAALNETVHQISNHLAGAVAIGTFFFDSARVLMYTDNYGDGFKLEDIKNENKIRKYIENCFQQFVHSVNHLSRSGSESPFTNVSVFDKYKLRTLLLRENLLNYYPEIEKITKNNNEEYNINYIIDYIYELQKIFIEFFDKGDVLNGGIMYRFPVVTVNFSKSDDNTTLLDKEFLDYMTEKDIYRYNIFVSKGTKLASCCRLINNVDTMQEYAAQSNSFGGVGISLGSHRVLTINFNRIALEAKTKEEYFKILEERISDSAKILRSHKNLIQVLADKGLQFFISNGWIKMDKLFSTFGILGLVEANELAKEKYNLDEEYDLIKESLEFLNKRMIEESKKYDLIGNIEQIPAETMAVRLCDVDKMLFGEDLVPYKLYANQFIPLWQDATMWEKLEADGKYNSLITGGGIVHAQISEKVTQEQAKRIIKFATLCGCEHFALNAIYTKCDNNHSSFGNYTTCPVCGSNNLKHFTRVVGFFTEVENWNPVRREWEFPRRKMTKIK